MKTLLMLLFGAFLVVVQEDGTQELNLDEQSEFKYMIQMINYAGEKAYIIVSLVNPQGEYESTLAVLGDDDEWYKDMKTWWSFASESDQQIDGITSASIGNGDRRIGLIKVNNQMIESGYKLRFESAVEDQDYFSVDVEVPLNSVEGPFKKEGIGWIRYIRLIPS